MRYYKLMMDAQGENDIVCHYQDDFGIRQNVLNVGKIYEGWFMVSNKLRNILKTMNTAIQFLPLRIVEKNSKKILEEYFIANIIRVVDALCLDKSKYFETEILGIGTNLSLNMIAQH
ncbi:MAG: hypothetical protein K2N55_03930 [Lachnospiraceae bacterium]|nr:hypothetical protein [Lachnospiraceae bacterium]